jgi:hypothetical protein
VQQLQVLPDPRSKKEQHSMQAALASDAELDVRQTSKHTGHDRTDETRRLGITAYPK